jgi:hypothetical protein
MSMKTNELRIGNYVKGIGHKISWLVEGIEPEYIYSSKAWRTINSFEGIPINSEWADKFGFKCIFTHDDHHYYNGFLALDRDFQPFDYDIKYEIEYVHQLQNLYYAITGCELTIKSE